MGVSAGPETNPSGDNGSVGRPRTRQPDRSSQAAIARAATGQSPTPRPTATLPTGSDTTSLAAPEQSPPARGIPNFGAWGKTPAPDPNQPGEVRTGQLGYYRQRAQDFMRRNPGQQPPEYYLKYGDKYAHAFTNLKPDLSQQGQKWVDATLKSLQEQIEAKRRENPAAFAQLERDPEAFKKFCYGTHPSAYLNSGLANLPPSDLMKIASTPDLKDLLGKEGIGPALQTTVGALEKNPLLALSVPLELSPLGLAGLNPFD